MSGDYIDVCLYSVLEGEWVPHEEWVHCECVEVERVGGGSERRLEVFSRTQVLASVLVTENTKLRRLDENFYHVEGAMPAAIGLQFLRTEDALELERRMLWVGEEEIRRQLEAKGFAARDVLKAQHILGREAQARDIINFIFDTTVEEEEEDSKKKAEAVLSAWGRTGGPNLENPLEEWSAYSPPEEPKMEAIEEDWSVYEGSDTPPPPPPPPRESETTMVHELEGFAPLRVLGRGAFSTVLLVSRDSQFMAMKVISKSQIVQAGLERAVKVERHVLRVVRHPFLVKLLHAFQSESRLYLLTDFYEAGSLEGKVPLGVEVARVLVAEVSLALAHLHSKNILHRDVKAANVLLDLRGHAHLADYGLAKVIEDKKSSSSSSSSSSKQQQQRSFAGTLEYMAPEYLAKNTTVPGVPADWWALGCLLAEISQGFTPFRATAPRQLMANILHADPVVKERETRGVLLEGLLVREPAKRLADVKSLSTHRFFRGLDFGKVMEKRVEPPFDPKPTSTDPRGVDDIIKRYFLEEEGRTPADDRRRPTTPRQRRRRFFAGFSFRQNTTTTQ
ncbi:hypothetical protein CTAYLR_000166 [Chrysophaeum taylorii]|uniref:Uncharacterized protein n=1 Tax=Chrysophaeum taylorii TaxID=2483200 RepID=A0AAD7XQT2_9STRA|nr:hypothetical protein CTAYLR_000166 [Chrysophaeum taylorii]